MIVHISHTDYSNTNPTLFLKKRLYNVEEFVIKKKKDNLPNEVTNQQRIYLQT
jgi:hypothetical protein